MWVDILYESLKIRLMFLILIFFSQTLRAMLMSRNSFKIGSKFKKNKIYIYSKSKFWFGRRIWGIYVASLYTESPTVTGPLLTTTVWGMWWQWKSILFCLGWTKACRPTHLCTLCLVTHSTVSLPGLDNTDSSIPISAKYLIFQILWYVSLTLVQVSQIIWSKMVLHFQECNSSDILLREKMSVNWHWFLWEL